MSDKKIAEVLAKFGEPMAGNVWRVQGNAVIYHKTLERIAAQARIEFDPPQVLRAERDEAVILVHGHICAADAPGGASRHEWSIGEALVGVNYRVSGKQAAYPYAMAEKRAKDRVILKLIELHGLVYSEEEADEFKAGAPKSEPEPEIRANPEDRQEPPPLSPVEAELIKAIKAAKAINKVTDFMLAADTQEKLNSLPESIRNEIRDFAKQRLVELGWPQKGAA